MPHELRSIRKLGLNSHRAAATTPADSTAGGAASLGVPPVTPAAVAPAAATTTLQLSVTKEGGPVATFVEIASSGSDDRVFNDHDLSAGGPAQMVLRPENFYTGVWRGAFVAPGSATLHIRETRADGSVIMEEDVPVEHPGTNSPFTIVVL